jgi:hypothetical protein
MKVVNYSDQIRVKQERTEYRFSIGFTLDYVLEMAELFD